MLKYSQLSYGSNGDDVKKLQSYLNQVGNYGLDEDGVYGSKTQDAVKNYQSSNNLTVDGIAGNQTWGSLSNAISKLSSSESTGSDSQNTAQTAPDYSKYSYDPSTDTAYQQALAALQQATSAVPNYQASYDDQLQEIYNQIVNRDKFSYDLNKDALYQQYADQYQMMGQQAMMDTMGQAAALTGGYGNSYASTAGNQAYQAYLQQLNEVVPELYGMALDQYNAEGDKLLTQYSMLGEMADDEYGKYQDALSQYWQNVSYQKQLADDAYNRGYGQYRDQVSDDQWYQSLEYQKERDQKADEQWQAQFDEAKRQYDQQYALSKSKLTSNSTPAKTPDTPTGDSYDNGGLSTSGIMILQKALGVTADGKWGPETQAAAKKKWGVTSADDAYQKYTGGKDANGDGWADETRDFDWVGKKLNEYIENGANKNEVNNFLTSSFQAGYITRDQYTSLKNTFIPR